MDKENRSKEKGNKRGKSADIKKRGVEKNVEPRIRSYLVHSTSNLFFKAVQQHYWATTKQPRQGGLKG